MCIHPRCGRRPIATLHQSKWGTVALCDVHLPSYEKEGTHKKVEYHKWYIERQKESVNSRRQLKKEGLSEKARGRRVAN